MKMTIYDIKKGEWKEKKTIDLSNYPKANLSSSLGVTLYPKRGRPLQLLTVESFGLFSGSQNYIKSEDFTYFCKQYINSN